MKLATAWLVIAFVSVSAWASEVWKAADSVNWDGKPFKTEDGIFRSVANQRLIGKGRFPIESDRKYTISGEFRLVGVTKPQPFFFGFMPMTEDGNRIDARQCRAVPRLDLAEVVTTAVVGATEVVFRKA